MSDLILSAIFQPWMLIIFLPLVYVLIRMYLRKKEFKGSSYSDASGNSYAKTVSSKGNSGEYLTFLELEKLDGDKRILTNLYLPGKDGKTTEVDLVMIHPTGIYVFESKNYSGWILGDDKVRYWTQSLNGGKKNKFFNPIWQNKSHIAALSKALGNGYEDHLYSYIVFSERCELNKSINELQGVVVLKRNRLVSKLRQDLTERGTVFMKTEMDELEELLKSFELADDATKAAHIESVMAK